MLGTDRVSRRHRHRTNTEPSAPAAADEHFASDDDEAEFPTLPVTGTVETVTLGAADWDGFNTSVVDRPSRILGREPRRRSFSFFNSSASPVYLGSSPGVSPSTGAMLAAGQTITVSARGEVFAVADAGIGPLRVEIVVERN
jgi:hypothetical protein